MKEKEAVDEKIKLMPHTSWRMKTSRKLITSDEVIWKHTFQTTSIYFQLSKAFATLRFKQLNPF